LILKGKFQLIQQLLFTQLTHSVVQIVILFFVSYSRIGVHAMLLFKFHDS